MRRSEPRGRLRGVAPVEAAIGVAIFGSLLAVAVPAFVRELHASRFVEPVEGLERMSAAALDGSHGKPVGEAFPPSAPHTPSVVPRGKLEVDPPGTWDRPTWQALHFQPVATGAPHAFAFAFENAPSAAMSRFVARANGDLDGDGNTSTFELRGHTDGAAPAIDPGMYVEAELE